MQMIEERERQRALPEPVLVDGGVQFSVMVEQKIYPCVVTSEALLRLSRDHGFMMDAMNTYRAFEAKINSVARSRLLRGDHHAPLILESQFFH